MDMEQFLHDTLAFYATNGSNIFRGFLLTVWICLLGIIGSLIFGFLVYVFSTIRNRTTTLIYAAYRDNIRGIPLLVLLFLLFYAAPRLGIVLSAFVAGLTGLIIYGSAYFAEIYRAGFESIPVGQIEAARAMGMSKKDTLIRIKFPQMMSLIIPPSTNMAIILIKESAVLSIITVPELTSTTGKIINLTFEYVQPYLAACVLYWIFVECVAFVGKRLEHHLTNRTGKARLTAA